MEGTFVIQLPSTAGNRLAEVQDEVRDFDGVAAASSTTRSFDPASAIGWVQLATESLTAAAAAVVVVQRVVEAIRGRGIRGAKLKFDGTEISVDEASVADIERLVQAVRGQRSRL